MHAQKICKSHNKGDNGPPEAHGCRRRAQAAPAHAKRPPGHSPRGVRASATAVASQAAILIHFTLRDDQPFFQANAPYFRHDGSLFLLSSKQQPQEHTAHNDDERHTDPSFCAVGGPWVQGAADAPQCAAGAGGAAQGGGEGAPPAVGRACRRSNAGSGKVGLPGGWSLQAHLFLHFAEAGDGEIEVFAAVPGADLRADARLALGTTG